MITREYILELITEEKEKFGDYVKLCNHYQIEANPTVEAVMEAKVDLLQKILRDIQ